MLEVVENAVVFGRFNGLVGIVSERVETSVRVDATDRCDQPALIILNTGIVHRVGPGRLGTILARRCAIAGHYALRFDFSGVGDSERRGDHLPPIEGAMADLREAMDWLQAARGVQRVILVGICTGADLSLLYAGTDSRVVGMVIVDVSTPPTRGYYLRKCLDHRVWRRKLQAIASVARAHRRHPERPISADVWQYDDSLPLNHPRVHAALADAYRKAFAGSVRTRAIFTTGAAWYNYRNQLFDAFPEVDFAGNLQFEYFKDCDHTITHDTNRKRLFAAFDSWLAQTEFKASPAFPEETRPLDVPSGAESNDSIVVEF
jgi:pimeloyl-ACP methyl ester carboxylesterase